MKLLLAIVCVVLTAPVWLVVGIALGPATLVMLFIGGFALIVTGLGLLVEKAGSRRARRA